MIRVVGFAALLAVLPLTATAQEDGPVRTAPAVAPATAPVPDEAAVEAAAAAFEAQMDDLGKALDAARSAAGTDAAVLKTTTDAIVAKYQPKADAFAEMVAALIASRPVAPDDQARARAAVQQVRDMPGLIRDHHLAPAPVAPASGPAAVPATTPDADPAGALTRSNLR